MMIVTRINGRYSIEVKNASPEDLVSDLETLARMIRMDMSGSDDCLFVTGCAENKENKNELISS